MFNKKKNVLLSCLLSTFIVSGAYADEVKTDGGIEVYRSADDRYWFSLHGVAKVDWNFFIGDHEDKQNELPSGTNIRGLETTLNGGIGKDITYTVTLGFENGVDVNDAYFTYLGFKNSELSFGQVISPFCLENSNSGKWIPFLERSLPVTAMRPCMGIGVNYKYLLENGMFNFSSTTPLHGTNKDSAGIMHRSDRLTHVGRFVYVPWRADNDQKLVQVGVSGVYGDNSPTFRDGSPNTDGRRFSTRPEARARNTPVLINSGNQLGLDHYTQFGVEAASLWGPLLVEAEYLQTDVSREHAPHLRFYGWHAQAAYMLTGETRTYKSNTGSFSGVKPRCAYGAWEVAARYSMVNLNDEDIHGGKEHNVSVSLGWYVNENVKILGNYIHARIDPTRELGASNPSPNHRSLDIIGLRSQFVW